MSGSGLPARPTTALPHDRQEDITVTRLSFREDTRSERGWTGYR